jgi:hypothetical protein
MKNKEVYILLSHSGSIISSMIKRFSELEYSHIAIGVDNSFKIFYSFGRRRLSNPLIAGFVSEDVEDGIYARFNEGKFSLYKLKVSKEQYNELVSELQYFEKNKKAYRYNFAGLLSAKAGYSLERKNAYFCSQFAAQLFESANIYEFNKKHGLITPMDFQEIPNIELISKGNMKDFRKNQWNVVNEEKSFDVMRFSKYCISIIRGI